MIKEELFYTDRFSSVKGFDRSMVYFDRYEKKVRGEMFCTDQFAGEKGYDMAIEYYDDAGHKTKKEYFNFGEPVSEDQINGITAKLTKNELFYTDKALNENE